MGRGCPARSQAPSCESIRHPAHPLHTSVGAYINLSTERVLDPDSNTTCLESAPIFAASMDLIRLLSFYAIRLIDQVLLLGAFDHCTCLFIHAYLYMQPEGCGV